MKKARGLNQRQFSAQRGFTLVELIVVIIILGVLSLAAVPRFTDRSGFSEYAFQQRLLGALRNLQLKAMFDTRDDFCYRMVFVSSINGANEFGPTTASYLNGQQANSCGTSIDNTSEEFLRIQNNEIANEGIGMNALDGALSISFVQFDNMGRPVSSAGSCADNCSITFQGEDDARVCIASEGFVYAC